MSLCNSSTPTGDLSVRRVTESPPIYFASVEYIVSNASITEAWKKVRSNKGVPGADGISIEKFPRWVGPQWNEIRRQLLEGVYKPAPALRVEIPKESGGVRRLGIPRVRLRMCYWKQWRRPRRRIRALINLGVNKRDAIRLGLSRKSYWRLSKTLATNSGLSNAHLEETGLISLRTLWCKIHHPATVR